MQVCHYLFASLFLFKRIVFHKIEFFLIFIATQWMCDIYRSVGRFIIHLVAFSYFLPRPTLIYFLTYICFDFYAVNAFGEWLIEWRRFRLWWFIGRRFLRRFFDGILRRTLVAHTKIIKQSDTLDIYFRSWHHFFKTRLLVDRLLTYIRLQLWKVIFHWYYNSSIKSRGRKAKQAETLIFIINWHPILLA